MHFARRGRYRCPASRCETYPGRENNTMRTAKPASALGTRLIVLASVAWLLAGCMIEQIMIGQRYTIRTPQAGPCPPLELVFVVEPGRKVSGSLSQVGRAGAVSLSGLLNPDDSFALTTTTAAGNRTSDVTGRFTSQVSTMSIHGDAAGSACDGQTFHLRLGGYFSRQGGGGGGGG
jgi:hypothetical protein